MAEVTNAELTSDILNGTGTLDVLMQSISTSLDEQFRKGRITGADYANVYLGTVSALVPQAVAFVLGKQQADKQAELIQKQIELADAQLLKEQLERDSIAKDILIKDEQIAKLQAEVTLTTTQNSIAEAQLLKEPLERNILIKEETLKQAQIDKLGVEESLVTAQVSKVTKENLLVDEQILIAQAQLLKEPLERNLLIKEEGIKDNQILKLIKDTALTGAQTTKLGIESTLITEQVNTATQETALAVKRALVMDEEILKIREEVDTMIKQQAKIDGEVALLASKNLTEIAQHNTNLPDGEGGTYPVSGILGKQLELFEEQKKGYADNTKHKAMSTLLDNFTVLKSNNSALKIPLGLDDYNLENVINAVRDSIGLAPSVPDPTDP